jgi:hypothetical protein
MMDILELKDGRVLVITEHGITLYQDRAAFDRVGENTPINTRSHS